MSAKKLNKVSCYHEDKLWIPSLQ